MVFWAGETLTERMGEVDKIRTLPLKVGGF